MNIWKKILGISLAVGLSVSMGIVPIYADSISILDEITEQKITRKTLQRFWHEAVTYISEM